MGDGCHNILPAESRETRTVNPTGSNENKSTRQEDVAQLQPDCPICTESFNEVDIVRVLPCKHAYHKTCIDPWLQNFGSTCPLW
jgi:hypothetical protein